MADDLVCMRRKQKNEWRQREEERRRKQLGSDSSSSSSSSTNYEGTNIGSSKFSLKQNVKITNDVSLGRTVQSIVDTEESNNADTYQSNAIDSKPSATKSNTTKYAHDNIKISCGSHNVQKHMTVDDFVSVKKINTSSPASSITCSQSPKRVLFSVHASTTTVNTKENHKVATSSDAIRPSNERKQPSIQKSDSSSTDDDEDLIRMVRDRNRKKKLSILETSTVQPKIPTCERNLYIAKQEETPIQENYNQDNLPITSLHSELVPKKTISTLPKECVLSDSSEDDDIFNGWRGRKQIQSAEDVSRHDYIAKQQSPTLKETMDIQQSSSTTPSDTKIRTTPRNPFTLMKEMNATPVLSEGNSDSKQLFQEDVDSKLWSESDNDTNTVGNSTGTTKTRKRKASINYTTQDKNSSDTIKERKKSKERKPTVLLGSDEEDPVLVSDRSLQLFDRHFNDNKLLEIEVKPEFEFPQFGPFEFVPLTLPSSLTSSVPTDTAGGIKTATPTTETTTTDICYEVPASINRYLLGYQRDGIRFLYNTAIASKRGAILGDDMGLGKTIQIVSLLAAILKKTGTGRDLIELKRRKSIAQSRSLKKYNEQHKALLEGKLRFDNSTNKVDVRRDDELALPIWCPILIVVPNSVVPDWIKAFDTWGYFGVSEYQGSAREAALVSITNGASEILVCPKSMFERKEHFEQLLLLQWKIVVIDEFHSFKNEGGHLAMNLRVMRDTLGCVVIGLTGTVMQNDHKELWNLIDLACKDYLGSWAEFEIEYARPIKLARTKDANKFAIELGRMKGIEFSNKLYEIYIRRTKQEVLMNELPMKDERIVFCELSSLQKQLYKHIIQQSDFKLLSESSGPCDCGVNQKFFLEFQHLQTKDERIAYQRKHRCKIMKRCFCCYTIPKRSDGTGRIDPKAILWRQQHKKDVPCRQCPFCILFPALQILYKVSSHASMLQLRVPPEQFVEGTEARQTAEDELERAKFFIPRSALSQLPGQSYIRDNRIMDDHLSLSGKMVVVDKLLKAIKLQQGRVLLFSFSTQMMDLLENYLVSKGYSHLRMDGSTSAKRRTELTAEFKKCTDIFVFLLSTKAMGLGLNLTEANFVIIFDVDWNPSNDAQAQDRAYRIGQRKNVKVFRLVSRGTVEELKYLRQVYKTQLKSETIVELDDDGERASTARIFRGVAGDKDRKGELFGLANLLKYNDGTFMNYAPKESESRQYGVGVHETDKLLDTVRNMTEEEFDEIGNDTRVYDDIAARTEQEDISTDHSDVDQTMLGGESQIVLDICQRNQPDTLPTDLEPIEEEILENGSNGSSSNEPTQLKTKNRRGNRRLESSRNLDSLSKKLDLPGQGTRVKQSIKPVYVPKSQKNHDGISSNKSDLKRTAIPSNKTVKPSSAKSSASRNTVLVGLTTNKIREGVVGTTAFSAHDLFLPKDVRLKKEKNIQK